MLLGHWFYWAAAFVDGIILVTAKDEIEMDGTGSDMTSLPTIALWSKTFQNGTGPDNAKPPADQPERLSAVMNDMVRDTTSSKDKPSDPVPSGRGPDQERSRRTSQEWKQPGVFNDGDVVIVANASHMKGRCGLVRGVNVKFLDGYDDQGSVKVFEASELVHGESATLFGISDNCGDGDGWHITSERTPDVETYET